MKNYLPLLLLCIISSCEFATLKYGFERNPIKVIDLANQAIKANQLDDWSKVLSQKALCLYGTEEGMNNVRTTLKNIDHSSLQLPTKVSANYLKAPIYMGYYSYYQEVYESHALDNKGNILLKATILCNFGLDENESAKINAKLSNYSIRSCSIIKIKNFERPFTRSGHCSTL